MDNFLVAASNLYACRAIHKAINKKEYLDVMILLNAMTASIVYHTLEVSKHNMTGIPMYQHRELRALNFDRVSAALVVARFVYRYRSNINKRVIVFGITGVGCLMLSECQHVIDTSRYPIQPMKVFYMITHIAWHIFAFHTAHLLLKKTKKTTKKGKNYSEQ